MDVVFTQCSVRYGSWGVVAFAVVEDVGAIEVVEAQILGERGEVLVEVALYGVGDIVEKRDEGI